MQFTFKDDVEPVFPFFGGPSEQFPERIFKDVAPPDVNGRLFPTNAVIHAFQLCPEVSPLNIEVQNSSVVHQNGERTVG